MGLILSISGKTLTSSQKIDPSRITFRRLCESIDRGAFYCGEVLIENWFGAFAFRDHSSLYSRVITAHLDNNSDPVGFFAMTLNTESESEISGHWSVKDYIFSGSSMIVVHLKYVAVREGLHRQGIGTLLMGRALDDFAMIADRAGAYAITLVYLSDDTRKFYESLGFEYYGRRKKARKMLLPAQSVLEAMMQEEASSKAIA